MYPAFTIRDAASARLLRRGLVMLCLLISCSHAFYDLDTDRGFARYPEEIGNVHSSAKQPHETSCIALALKLCPTRKSSFGYHLNEHLKCIIPKADQLPPGCRATVLEMEHCAGDIDHFCDGLSTHDTELCMEAHLDQLHEDCLSSYFMKAVHARAGRDTRKYLAQYKAHEDEHARLTAVRPHTDL